MRSALYLCPVAPTHTGYYPIGNDGDGNVIIHAAPGAPAPEGATLIVDGSVTPWAWLDLETIDVELADFCIQATWQDGIDGEGNPVIVRGARADASGPLITDGLPPHFWFGDSE